MRAVSGLFCAWLADARSPCKHINNGCMAYAAILLTVIAAVEACPSKFTDDAHLQGALTLVFILLCRHPAPTSMTSPIKYGRPQLAKLT
jgi:hypothetical protein